MTRYSEIYRPSSMLDLLAKQTVDQEDLRRSMSPYSKEGEEAGSNSKSSSSQPGEYDAGMIYILINSYSWTSPFFQLSQDKGQQRPQTRVWMPPWPFDISTLLLTSKRSVIGALRSHYDLPMNPFMVVDKPTRTWEFYVETTISPWPPPRPWPPPQLDNGVIRNRFLDRGQFSPPLQLAQRFMSSFSREGDCINPNSRSSSFQPGETDAGEIHRSINSHLIRRLWFPQRQDDKQLRTQTRVWMPPWPFNMVLLHPRAIQDKNKALGDHHSLPMAAKGTKWCHSVKHGLAVFLTTAVDQYTARQWILPRACLPAAVWTVGYTTSPC